jgi:hypothetical protein
MTVKKKSVPSIDKFIDKGAEVKAIEETGFKNILIRIPTSMLNRIDMLLEDNPWISRTHWILEVINEELESFYEG